MRFFEPLVVATVCLLPGAALPECFVCDEVVELTEDYANCFTENFDLLLEAFEASESGRQTVNLASCAQDSGTAGSRSGLIEMGQLPASSRRGAIKSVYILDRPSALCLRALLEQVEGPLAPSRTFDLVEACDGG